MKCLAGQINKILGAKSTKKTKRKVKKKIESDDSDNDFVHF